MPIFVPTVDVPPPESGEGWWFPFRGSRLLITPDGAVLRAASLEAIGLSAIRTQPLGRLDGVPCYAAEIPEDAPLPDGVGEEGLRALFAVYDDVLTALAGRAFQVMDWDRTHQYCGRCGTPTLRRPTENARSCPACRLTTYPRICPAIMVLITRGRELLLARKSTFPPGRYSALAGFVEAGESLEETLAREAKEEVGVDVTNIRYFGSQSWPFPNSLMVAFTAEYAGGDIVPDGVEIEDARWFDIDAPPRLPDRISISRWMIDGVRERLAGNRTPGS